MVNSFIHITLSLSVFFSSAGFWSNSHYCQGQLIRTSYILNLGSCCAGETSDSCASEKMSCSQNGSEDEDNCCSSKSSFHKLEQSQQLQAAELTSIEQPELSKAIVLATNTKLPLIDNRTLRNHHYESPLIVYDRQVRLQSFLC